jgi:U3 small nucleolar RNA-associated protein 14
MTKKKQKSKVPRPVEAIEEEEDDEEISEDEAFNSDDERKYGSFFHTKDPQQEEDDDDQENSDDDDDNESDGDEDDETDDEKEDDDGGQYMLDLLDKLNDNSRNKKESSSSSSTKDPRVHSIQHLQESEFSSAVVNPDAPALTLDGLLGGLEDTAGFGWVQKTLQKVAKGAPTAAPAPKVVSDRAERKVHYGIQARAISKQFNEIVHKNRNAETLDFRNHSQTHVLNNEILVDKFVPTTEFEKQLAKALEQAGQIDEEAILKAEQERFHDDLGSAKMSMEEFQKRRGQLAKMRALLFYHEQKRHHINKIKSKKYRKIRKKQRERQKEAELSSALEQDNVDLVRELEEKEEVERMKERATLAHKNTSKWAKRVLKRGKHVDLDTRRALSAQLAKGENLRKRIQSTMQSEDDQNDTDSDYEGNDLIESARHVLRDTEQKDAETEPQGLFKLSFMQRGLEKQRAQAREEARQLLMELEAENENEQDHQQSDSDEEHPGEDKQKELRGKKRASKEEMKTVLNQGDLLAASLKHGTANVVTMSGNISVDVGFYHSANNLTSKSDSAAAVTEHKTSLLTSETAKIGVELESKQKSSNNSKTRVQSVSSKTLQSDDSPGKKFEEEESNPWLEMAASEKPLVGETRINKSSSKSQAMKAKERTKANKRGFVDIDRAVDMLEVPKAKPMANEEKLETKKSAEQKVSEKSIVMLTQEELVRKAFAAPVDLDMDDEFAKEKDATEKEEDPTRKIPKNEKDLGGVSGWGSWAGKGAPPLAKSSSRRKIPPKLQPPEVSIPKRQRLDAKKPGVIISQKRISKAGKYLLAEIPYPFTSREEYERSMVGGIGREWNVTSSFKAMTRPEIYRRAGKVIQPLSQKVSQSLEEPF